MIWPIYSIYSVVGMYYIVFSCFNEAFFAGNVQLVSDFSDSIKSDKACQKVSLSFFFVCARLDFLRKMLSKMSNSKLM